MSRLWAAKIQLQNAVNLLNDSKISACFPWGLSLPGSKVGTDVTK